MTLPSIQPRLICAISLTRGRFQVTIEASKDGIKFAANGDIGSGAVTLRSSSDVEKPELNIDIELTEPVSLTFSLKYLVNFCKAQNLSKTVKICLSDEVPLLVEYTLAGTSYLRFYLAPKACFLYLPLTLPHECSVYVWIFTNMVYRLVTRSKCPWTFLTRITR
jgi:proliferating cell nuclear antigen